MNVYSCVPDDGYAFLDGTSMAAPHVAGLAATRAQYIGEYVPSVPALS